MSRIAVKIFLSFWLAFFLVLSGFSAVIELLRDRESAQALGAFQQRQLQQHQEQLQTIHQTRGVQGLRRFAKDIQDNRGITLFLLGDDGVDWLEKPVPPDVLAYFKRNRQIPGPQMQVLERRMLLGPAPLRDATPSASILLWLPMAANEAPPLLGFWKGRYAMWQLGLGLLVSGVVSLVLALSLTRPLNRLERATQQLAQGRFDTQDIDAVARRKDEIGSLARGFSSMASRLDQALESQQRLLRDVSHELRSPLTRLQVAIGLASRQAVGGNVASFERMEAECERLNALIGEVLALARVGSSKKESDCRDFDLSATLQALTSDARFEAQAQQKDVLLEAPEHLMFYGNEAALASAVENVVRNAIRYTVAGSTVRLSAKSAGQWVYIGIEDAGPGLPNDELDKIFIPFYRVSQARERETGGTGVGLAIAARVVQWHGGVISARNRAQGGLVIDMRLPRRTGPRRRA